MEAARPRIVEDPYGRVLRIQEEAHAFEVKAHQAILEARRFEAKAARLALKEKRLRGKATARVGRSHSVGERATAKRYEEQAVDSQAEQLRIAARGKMRESSEFLVEAKRLFLEAEAAKAL